MTWQDEEVRKIKLVLERPIPKADNLSVIFSIPGKQKLEFETMLTGYLTFIEANEGVIKVNESLDAETSELCELHISITGLNQAIFAQELQSRARPFSAV